MLRPATWVGVVGIVAILAATTMAACSGSSSAQQLVLSDPKGALRAAVDKTINVDSARVSSHIDLQQQAETEHIEAHALYDYRNRRGNQQFTLETASRNYTIRVIETGDRIYISLPTAAARQQYHATWVSTDLDAYLQALGDNDTAGPNLNVLYAFAGARQITQRPVLDEGRVQLHTSISLDDAAAAIGSDKAPLLNKAFHVYGPGSTVTGTATLDRDGFIRSATLDGSAGSGEVQIHESLTIDDINNDVPTPTPPPANKTQEVDAQELANLVQQGG